MKNLKVIMIIIVVMIIILIATLILIKNVDRKEELEKENYNDDTLLSTTVKTMDVSDRTYYSTVLSCINQYLATINKNNSSYFGEDNDGNLVLTISEEEINQKIYNLLSKEYIEKNNITIKNIKNYINNITEDVLFVPIKMKVRDNGAIGKYLVYGLLEKAKDNSFMNEVYFMVILDSENMTYSIEPILEQITDIEKIQIENSGKSIEKNDENEFEYVTLTQEKMANEYLVNTKRLLLGKPELAYEYLESEYKKNKFSSLEDFRKYIQRNEERIKTASIDKYMITNRKEYKEIICVDKKGKYYIIKEKGILNYSIALDTYTIDIPQFMEKYNSSTVQNKVALNIEKVKEALNDGDYKYVYSKLAPSFKQNYFTTEASFEEYAKQKFYQTNEIEYTNFEGQNGNYMYTVEITDKNDETKPAMTKTIVMQLQEEGKFIMSFSVE